MSERDAYLRPMLDAGSSRVFNCCDRFRRLRSEGAENALFFKHERFHSLVIIKEANLDPFRTRLDQGLLTKLYFPYNAEDIYEGGRSIFLHDPKLLRVLNELLGLEGVKFSQDAIRSDIRMLQIFDGLPSLDAFLMRDALELQGIQPNPLYLDVSDEEREAIYAYIRRRFEPLVSAALDDSSVQSRKVSYLVDKVWEAKDLVALDPLITACRFPRNSALSIFSAWKGIYYYAFEYERSKPRIDSLTEWLSHAAAPRAGSVAVDVDQIAFLKKNVTARLTRHAASVSEIVGEYDGLYDRFLVDPEATTAFIGFLRRARDIYWRMGEALSALNHAANCWELSTANFPERRLPVERLLYVLDCLLRVLAGERSSDRGTAGSIAFR